ncbi:Serine acetyltransferase [Mycobacteroides abscessus subsp. abscessus]|nr:Serine acetyltransferase [Mycobacteroides abscessus subsp. abscessus]
MGIPGKVVIKDGVKLKKDLNHSDLPDPVSDRLVEMEKKLQEMQVELEDLRRERSLK